MVDRFFFYFLEVWIKLFAGHSILFYSLPYFCKKNNMIDGFENLNKQEWQQLLDAPVQIAVLIGAADGVLDREEMRWSDKMMESRSYAGVKMLRAYYDAANDGFYDRMKSTLADMPKDTTERNERLSEQLAHLNAIFSKLDPVLAGQLYKSYLGLAEETARASGGFLRIGAVSAAEHLWVKLPMITPVEVIALPAEPEEEEEENDEL